MSLKPTKTKTAKTVLKAASTNTKKGPALAKVTEIPRYNRIEKAAYYLAQKENFNGNSVEQWLQAEANIDGKLAIK